MVPVPITSRHTSRLLYIALSAVSTHVPRLFSTRNGGLTIEHSVLERRKSEFDPHKASSVVFVVLIPILVLSSGLFAGLTLGYMSLDETQLNVLSISGTPDQRKYANKIKPIRKNGHLLLVTLLLANMIVNESLPVIADPILGGGVQSVVVSTVLIVIFAEIIPQSLFTRHGLYLGAKMAGFTKILIYVLGVVAWPVAKLLEFVLGSHHGIIYRRAELKELIAMHSSLATHGGDLKTDTVTIIGATLDLQEKVVRQAMTPIADVFMLSIDSKLDYELLKKICQTGHSRVPVYEEVEVPASVVADADVRDGQRMQKVKKIIGILLVKQCVLLDPKDATPLRKIPLNKVPFVPNNEPLLGILDRFQEGRSHMAIVSRFSVEKAASVKKAVKRGLTQRLRKRVGMDTDSDTETESTDEEKPKTVFSREKKQRKLLGGGKKHVKDLEEGTEDGDTIKEAESSVGTGGGAGIAIFQTAYGNEVEGKLDGIDAEKLGVVSDDGGVGKEDKKDEKEKKMRKTKISGFQLPKVASAMTSMSLLEQDMPADAVLAKEGAAEFLQGYDPAVMPLGIITLEDVLEELIGEEIYDEFDDQGAHGDPYEVPPAPAAVQPPPEQEPTPDMQRPGTGGSGHAQRLGSTLNMPGALKGLFRTRSAPPVPREMIGHESNADGRAEKTVRIDEGANTEIGDGAGAGNMNRNTNSPVVAPGTNIVMPRPIRGTGRHPPSVILEQHSSVSSSGSGADAVNMLAPAPFELPSLTERDARRLSVPSTAPTPAPGGPTPAGLGLSASAGPQAKVPSRTASPAPAPSPALEAILLDRKRRLQQASGASPQLAHSASQSGAGAGGSALLGVAASMLGPTAQIIAGAALSRAASSASAPGASGGMGSPSISPAPSVAGGAKGSAGVPKGTRFKSSPLGGVDRAGMVVAEEVNAVHRDAKGETK